MDTLKYTSQTKEELFQIFNTREEGLSYSEVNLLKNKFGLNEVKTK